MKKEKAISSHQKSRNPVPPRSIRRRVLRMGIAGTLTSLFVPAQWVRPVVQVVLLPAHATTSPSCDLQLDGCVVTCDSGSTNEPFFNSLDYKLYTLEIQDGCPQVADLERTQPDIPQSITPGPNQLLVTCNQYTFELAPTFVEVTVKLPEQSDPYAVGEWTCGLEPEVAIPGGEFDDTIEVDGVTLRVHTEIAVGSGAVELVELSVTPL